ncbi:BTAD domain-containing putative transcriptional regulator [Streptomyces sp. NRRL F-5630]|uniref:AfsR/SARP family transcriptional regulator n=1 Tax=Streptomyces sp. NRRL F-5630 TaxID=1463864 RepID=UPI003D7040AF
MVDLAVLGPLAAYGAGRTELPLGGPRQRAVLARLLVARRQVVPLPRLVADLWDGEALPRDPEGAVRTFVAALRRVLEPGRRPRTAAKLLVTEGPGYALRAAVDDVDAWRFERAARADEAAPALVETLEGALALWRGPAFADVAAAPWARAEAARLESLRLHVVERAAGALLARGGAARAVPDLEEFVATHPAREEGWRLLALALYRSGRQADALSALRRARRTLDVRLGVEPGARLSRLEQDILRQAPHLDPAPEGGGQVWARAAEAYTRALPVADRSRLRTAAALMRDVAVTGGEGLSTAREHRLAAVAEARRYGDAELTARVIGVYDVPALWTRSDDPVRAARLVAAAEDVLRELPPEREAERARLLATVAVESRGAAAGARSLRAAREAEALARRLGDPGLLAFALNGAFVQSFARAPGGAGGGPGRARAGGDAGRDALGAELVAVAGAAGLVPHEVLGLLVRTQARCGLGDFAGAEECAAAADALAARHELPLVRVFTTWFRALRASLSGGGWEPYEEAVALLPGCGMPGFATGLPALARLTVALRSGQQPAGEGVFGPYEPWVRPLLDAYGGAGRAEVARAVAAAPEPPGDHLTEVLRGLTALARQLVGEAGSGGPTGLVGAGSGVVALEIPAAGGARGGRAH